MANIQGATTAPATDNIAGAAWMLASAVTFVAMMSLVKFLGANYSVPLQTFFRQAAMTLVIAPAILRYGSGAFATTRPLTMIWRSVLGITGLILSYYSYSKLPLATANALSFTRSLWMLPLAMVFFGEKLRLDRGAAALAGFIGVLIMCQASGDGLLGDGALAGLAAAGLFACTITGMKSLTRDHSLLSIVCWSAVLGLILSFIPALPTWRWPDWHDVALLAGMGLLAVINQTCYARGMKIGDAMVMGPIDYTRLVFAAFAGWLFFDEIPARSSLIGVALIIGAAGFLTWRERPVRELSEV